MKKILLTEIICMGTILFAASSVAAKQKSDPVSINITPAEMEANYTRAIEGRTANILTNLDLTNAVVAANVHDIIIAQWRALRAWHDTNDLKLKMASQTGTNTVARIEASLKKLHNEFIGKLSENLTPQQIETVKDRMTYNKVEVTYNAYVTIVPNLTDADKAKILELLKEAREEAMDCGSAREKSAVFKKYKGKINNYLSANGHDVGKAYKDWGARQKQKINVTSNAPAK